MKHVPFDEYKKLQEEGSGWSYNSAWGDQMVVAIKEFMQDQPKNSTLLDVGCGEGRGLQELIDIGFSIDNLVGIDISTEKTNKAKERKLIVFEKDFHNLYYLENTFDNLFCSHAIEHSLDPVKVLKNCYNAAKRGLFIVPIDNKEQPPLGESPHTHNFYTNEDWFKVWNEVVPSEQSEHVSKTRIGKEIWSYWTK